MKKIKVLIVFVLTIFVVSNLSFAQTSSEIEMAKKIARQQGYSDSEIDAILNKSNNSLGTLGNEKIEVGNVIVRSPIVNNDVIAHDTSVVKEHSDIYGHDIFNNKSLNFTPSYNMPTPENYKLGVGDEIVIDLWGDVNKNIISTISPEGAINIEGVGPVYLVGKTIRNAESYLKSYLSKIYSGLSGPEPTVNAKLSLGKISSITINILGEVKKPGTYTLPSLSTIASAMYLAEGSSKLGTIRDIKLYRNNKIVSSFDVYDFIFKGQINSNIRLEDNDIIIVEPYKSVVKIVGGVKRPMKYELNNNESLKELLLYSGGFNDIAYTDEVLISRKNSKGFNESFNVKKEEFHSFKLVDGDVVSVKESAQMDNINKVSISGPIMRPGSYAIEVNSTTLLDLIKKAGGLRENAYLNRGYIERLNDNKQKEQVSFNLQNVILGKERVVLKRDDSIKLFSIEDITPFQQVKIMGEIREPGKFTYREGMTIGDLILTAGGLTESATLMNVEVARRLKIDSFTEDIAINDTVAIIMKYNLLENPDDANTILQPFDIVFVRESPMYKPQTTIKIEGEVKYPGVYAIEKNVVRLSDILNRAQGFTNDAYKEGSRLMRSLTTEEYEKLLITKDVINKNLNDTIIDDKIHVGEKYPVAININEALKNPGSDLDLVLREGDVIIVPKFENIVKISGAVLRPNTITYNPKYSLNDYISNAGGVSKKGIKRKTYMIHMNGSVAIKGMKDFKARPGTEIVVPFKDDRNNYESLANVLSIASTSVYMAGMIVAVLTRL